MMDLVDDMRKEIYESRNDKEKLHSLQMQVRTIYGEAEKLLRDSCYPDGILIQPVC